MLYTTYVCVCVCDFKLEFAIMFNYDTSAVLNFTYFLITISLFLLHYPKKSPYFCISNLQG